MTPTDILTCVWIVLGIIASLCLCFRLGYLNGRDDANSAARRECDKQYAEGYKHGQTTGEEIGYTKGRAEGYEDGRRYEAVTHHNQTELEKLLEKESKKQEDLSNK